MPFLEETADLTTLGPNSNNRSYGTSTTNTNAVLPSWHAEAGSESFPGFINGQRNTNPSRNVPPETPPGIPPTPTPTPRDEFLDRLNTRTPPKRPMDVFGAFARTPQDAKRTIGTNYFLDINAHGFRVTTQHLSTDFKLDQSGDPVIPPTKYLDSKGDFTPKFNRTSKAADRYNTPPSPVQDIPAPADLFLDSKGDFVPVFNINKKLTPPSYVGESRLENLHIFPFQDSFLDKYYARLVDNTDPLGIRNDGIAGRFNDNQPGVVREIGKRWGEKTFKLPDGSPQYAQKAIDIVSDIGESVLGRNPAMYVDRYIGDVTRLLPFANPAGTYALAQSILQKKNPFKWPTSIQYSFSGTPGLKGTTIEGELKSIYSDASSLIDPRGYNPLSIFSAPGVVHLSRYSTVLDPMTLIKKAPLAAAALAGIAGTIGVSVLRASAPVAANIVVDVVNVGLGGLGTIGKGLAGKLGDGKFPKMSFSQDTKDFFGSVGGAVASGVGAVGGAVGAVGDWAADAASKIKFKKGKAAGQDFSELLKGANKIGEWGVQTLATGVEIAGQAAEYARDKAKDIMEGTGKYGKEKLSKIDLTAFNNMGVDYVNLIEAYKEHYEGKSFRELDSIPFKFHDIRHDKPIVFRAILSAITDTFTPEYSSERYVGRPDKVHVYQGTDREISFTFDVYPKSDMELLTLWEKLNALAGLTYPHMTEPSTADGGRGMISPYTRLTIGDMYKNAPGIISSLTYTVMDEGTWETSFAKLPKYIQVNVGFTYIGNHILESKQKLFDADWISENIYSTRLKSPMGEVLSMLTTGDMSMGRIESFKGLTQQGLGGDVGAITNAKKQASAMLGSLGL